MVELSDRLNKAHLDLTKVNKLCDKVLGSAEALDTKGAMLLKGIDQMYETQQEAEAILFELSYMIKFKKTQCGRPLDVDAAKSLHQKAASCITSLFDIQKSLKVLFPKKDAA